MGVPMKTRAFIGGLMATTLGVASAIGQTAPGITDWGGGFKTGVDPILNTAAKSGNGQDPTTLAAAQTPMQQKCAGLAAYAAARTSATTSRERFARIPDAPTQVLKAEVVPAGGGLPEICRVSGVVAPSINFELSLPTSGWNGKFMHYGCGGACGVVYRPQLEEPLARGYAVIASDMGHAGAPNSSAYRWANLQAIIDFGYRATHVVTLAGKEIVDEFYGQVPAKSYYMGCSTGGVQGVIEAQRYPYDFDGILVGAPAYSSGPSYLEWNARANLDTNGDPILTPDKLPMIRKAVLADCDKLDGLADGLIQNPLACKWDPAKIQCAPGADTAACLTAAQVAVIRKIYTGPTDSKGHSLSYGPAGMSRGSEWGWTSGFIVPKSNPSQWLANPDSSYGDGVYPQVGANAAHVYDYDKDPQRGDIYFGGAILGWMRYAGNPDLRRFRDNGGKMIMYHGWDDNEVSPGASVDYDQLATATMGGEAATQKFFRLFMMPGMGHCRRGPGGDAVDYITYLENWVEKGQAPDQVIIHHLAKEQNYLGLPRPRYPLAAGAFDKTRPAYPFPDVAVYSGKGDPNQASSWKKAPRAAGAGS